MSCVLRAKGTNFAVDEFLSKSTLKPVVVFRRGQSQYPNSAPHRIPNASGFHAVASEADFSQLQVQIGDAVQFLEQNHAELARLVALPEVERVSLDFGIEERDVAAQSECFAFHPISYGLREISVSGLSSPCIHTKSPNPSRQYPKSREVALPYKWFQPWLNPLAWPECHFDERTIATQIPRLGPVDTTKACPPQKPTLRRAPDVSSRDHTREAKREGQPTRQMRTISRRTEDAVVEGRHSR